MTSQVFNIITTLFYWTLLGPAKFTNPKNYENTAAIFDLFISFFIHTFPFIASTVNLYLLSDVICYYSDIWFPIALGLLYSFLNFSWTTTTGLPIYPFLTWSNFSIIGAILFSAFVLIIFIFTSWST